MDNEGEGTEEKISSTVEPSQSVQHTSSADHTTSQQEEETEKMEVETEPPSDPLTDLPSTSATSDREKMEVADAAVPSEPLNAAKEVESMDVAEPTILNPNPLAAEPPQSDNPEQGKTVESKNDTVTSEGTKIETTASNATITTNDPKPVSIFASLFPIAKPSGSSKSRTPTPPVFEPQNVEPKSETNTEVQKQIKTEAIAQVANKDMAVDETKVSADSPKVAETEPPTQDITTTGSSGDVVKRASPRLQQLSESKQTANAEKMDVVEPPVTAPSPKPKPPTPRPVSTSPRMVTDTKSMKHPPIAGKTIKRERRKSSNASPTMSGEPKKTQRIKSSSSSPGVKLKKNPPPPKDDQDGRNDFYCWVCHKEGEVLCCELCPRVFHAKCLNMAEEPEGDWFCPECEKITDAECKETQSRAMSMLTIDQFSLLLKHVIQRMKIPLSEPFHEPVDTKMFPDYLDYVFHPMDLETIEKNVKKRKYGCPEAFVSDFKWVVHNCVLYNSLQSKLTQTAKAMLKVAERELNEIEVCPECYLNSCRKRENWFCEPCKELHPLVWAKLQGFPHWPAKALRIEKGLVDVRFFGQHDRAWIPISGCYLISKELPLPIKNKKKSKGPGLRGGLDFAMQEMQGYIENIKKITGEFEYAPLRTPLTHCDLYRKSSTAKVPQALKIQDSIDEKPSGSMKADELDIKAKVELREIAPGGKDLIRSRAVGQTTPKKNKTVTTGGEHPTRSFGSSKKKKASMEFLTKTIESCKASLGIEKIQDVKMNSGSEESMSSSDEDENVVEEGKGNNAEPSIKAKEDAPGPSAPSKHGPDEDDSDAELVIDLGDMDDSTDATAVTKTTESDASKTSDALVKKRKPEESSDKPPATKPAIKSILLKNPPKPTDHDERKKMLAKALSEKIGGKRKPDSEMSAPGHVAKVRKTLDQSEKRGGGGSPSEQRIQKSKEWKKPHHTGKYLDKDGKVKPGILKSSGEMTGQRRDSSQGEKRLPEGLKQRQKDGAPKSILKKPHSDKPGRIAQIPTEADTRKLFNGGRIPRKAPTVNVSDEEQEKKDQDDNSVMDTSQDTRPRVTDNTASTLRHHVPRSVSGGRQNSSSEQSRKSIDENITLANLKKYSDKVMDTVQKVFYEMYNDMMVPLSANSGSEAASATAMHEVAQMRLELERLKWMHEQEVAELKHNHDLTVAEIRQSLEYEKNQLLIEAKVKADAEKDKAVDDTKRKQWCAYCNKEAIFYCCWNTSYCDYPCQQKHWPEHMNSCSQAKESSAHSNAAETTAVSSTVTQPVVSTQSVQTPLQITAKIHLTSPTKPTVVATSSSPVKTTIKPDVKSKPIFNLATIKPSSSIVTAIKTKPKVTVSTSQEKPSKTIVTSVLTQQQQKMGSAISAIGARLLAAKQRDDDQNNTEVATSTKSIVPHITNVTTTVTDHVKTTMESPMSPEPKVPSPKPIFLKPKAEKTEDVKTDETTKKEDPIPSENMEEDIQVEPTKPSNEISIAKTEPTTSAPAKFSQISPPPKTATKLLSISSKTVFSSPSAVASLIAEMGTPLSSTLSSPESPSFTETPEKEQKPQAPAKVQLSLTGSAFSKVSSDGGSPGKIPEGPTDKNTLAVISSDPKPVDEPIEPKPQSSSPVTMATPDDPSIPVVAPVLSDTYLTSLQKTLPPKTRTPPIPTPEEPKPESPIKGELPRPTLPESDSDKSILSESKITDSDAGEPMDTDNKG